MQRVSIGRAIVREPRAFLMDEPLSNLDAKLREALRAELKDLQMKLGATFLFVTHDQVEAMSMGDKVGVLNAGQHRPGRARRARSTTTRATSSSPSFVGSPPMNIVSGELQDGQRRRPVRPARSRAGRTPIRHRLGGRAGPVRLGIRPEDVSVGPAAAVEARVHHVENHGVEKIVTLRVDDHLFNATIPATVRDRDRQLRPLHLGPCQASLLRRRDRRQSDLTRPALRTLAPRLADHARPPRPRRSGRMAAARRRRGPDAAGPAGPSDVSAGWLTGRAGR